MGQIILASASPRRKELLEQIGLEFEICPAKSEEVISIGVPTVVDAATIVGDTMEEMVETLDSSGKVRGFGGALGTLNRVEKQQMIRHAKKI